MIIVSEEQKGKGAPQEEFRFEEEAPIETSLKHAGQEFRVLSGRLPIRGDDEREIEGQMFFHAYLRKGADARRPLVFAFNGGPGSPSLWLHLGALGPKRAVINPDNGFAQPPFPLVENKQSWVQDCDIVFLDPIGTGFSRAKNKEVGKKFWGLKGDAESVSEAIRLFLTRYNRWSSPLFLAGESYGTTRAAAISGHLIDRGVAFNGLILVSSILNFQTARFHNGNDLPFALFMPTYATTAHYHGRVKGDLQSVINEAREFALGDYWSALAQGSALSDDKRKSVRAQLSKLTGLSETYLDYCDLRPLIHAFCKELLRDEHRSVGRLDSRFKGFEDPRKHYDDEYTHDPCMSAIMAPYTACYLNYVRTELGYETDLEYRIFNGIGGSWDWGNAGDGHPDTSEALRKAMVKNPHLKVLITSGYYDLATPYFATEYTLAHMGLNPELVQNVVIEEYEAGHMMYVHEPSLNKLRKDFKSFLKFAGA